MNHTKNRSPYWDIAKGLGIIAIVLGHSRPTAFVYLYHLALFFFVSGYLYSEKRYGDSPFAYFGARMAGAWPRYFFYTALFVLAHNFFVSHGLYEGQELYNHTRMLAAICSNLAFSGSEPIQGALWFIPVWLASSAMFAGTVWFGRAFAARIGGRRDTGRLKLLLIALANLAIGTAGVFLNMRKCGIMFNLQTAFLAVPLFFFAYLLRSFLPDFKRYTPWYGCILSALLLLFINRRLHIFIDLASMSLPGFWFYPISLTGIYFTLSLSALAEQFRPVAAILSFLGRHSFDIMAAHFALFKLIDLAYARSLPQPPQVNLASFPGSFSGELWPLYVLIGVSLPAAFGLLLDQAARLLLPGESSRPQP